MPEDVTIEQTSNEQQNEFRDYLATSGFLGTFTNAFISLYNAKPRPEDPFEFLKNILYPDYEKEKKRLEKDIEDFNARIKQLEADIVKEKQDYEKKLNRLTPPKQN
ncbi:hypothetical protein WA158_008366 [Blastocystis sp. Blastoise]